MHVLQCEAHYLTAYQACRGNRSGRDASQLISDLRNTHNEYLLQLRAANRQEAQFTDVTLPDVLAELEDIDVDVATTLRSSLECHALVLLTKVRHALTSTWRQLHPDRVIWCCSVMLV